ncbi:MAG TPA: prepilin-type N-terminal cleavage/methylation domain-containing protein, partial [Thermoanaerobaculia bacterium]|nr:prepilin-type N-terminal cleavage/methylation domain-containing protein [Thermoanaerobaculia bacterium]
MPNHAPAAERGFGLVEALVALALIALVLALALLVLFRLGRGFAELTARLHSTVGVSCYMA